MQGEISLADETQRLTFVDASKAIATSELVIALADQVLSMDAMTDESDPAMSIGVARLHLEGDDLAVDGERLVRDELARLGARAAEAHAVDHVVQARLEQRQQVRAGVALAALGLGEVAAELALQHAVHALDLLLLAQLQAEVAGARAAGAAVLAGLGFELGLVADGAARALQEQVGAFTAGEFGLGAEVTCHLLASL